jgi:hypothetical protein
MKRLILTLAVLALALPAGAAEICIAGSPDICYTTTADQNTGGLYYQTLYDDALCASVSLAAGCTAAEYSGAGGEETFYSRDAQGGKQFFMDTAIIPALQGYVTGYESDINTRARDYWNSLSIFQKETQCEAWGKQPDCEPLP